MSEVTFQHGINEFIVYKDGMREKGLEYLNKKRTFEEEIYTSISYWILVIFIWFFILILAVSITENLCCFAISFGSILLLSNAPLAYYQIRHDMCVKEVHSTPNYVTANTNRRGWWKW